jgi:tetratricopeptide (TPR) repeat protein
VGFQENAGNRRILQALCVWAVLMTCPMAAIAQVREKPKDILLFGLNAFQDEFYDPAANALMRYLRLQPGGDHSTNARYFLAEALRRGKRFKEAILAHREFLSRHPKDKRAVGIRFRMAEIFEKLGDQASATRVYKSIPKGPLRAESIYRVALLCMKGREWMGASAALKEFIDLAPDDPRVEPALYERARALDRLRRFDEAGKAYQLAIDRFPKSKKGHAARRRLGFVKFELKKYVQAESIFKEVMKNSPEEVKSPDLRLALAASLYGQKKYEAAAREFEESLNLHLFGEQKRTAERGVAESWWNDKKYQRAADSYRRLILGEEENTRFLARFIESLKLSGGCGWNGRESLRFAIRIEGRSAELNVGKRLMFANCLQSAGMEVEAVKHYKNVATSKGQLPFRLMAELRLAEILEESGHPKEAALRYEGILLQMDELKMDDKAVHPKLLDEVYQGALRAAGTYFNEGKCKSALRLATKVPRKAVPEKKRVEVASLRGECAFREEKLDEAELYFGRVLTGQRRLGLGSRARLRLAEISEARGNNEEALRRLMESLPLLPVNMQREARLNAGRLLRESGKIEESRSVLLPVAMDESADLESRKRIWLMFAQDAASAGNWTGAIKAFEYWGALAPSSQGDGFLLWATVLVKAGNCPRAVEIARRALSSEPDKSLRIGLLRIVASCFLKQRKFLEAASLLEDIRILAPSDSEVVFQLGVAVENTGDPARAAKVYASFLSEFPGDEKVSEAALRLGFLETGEGKRESALEAYRIAERSHLARIAEPARYQLALYFEDKGDLDEALKSYERISEFDLGVSKWRRAAAWRAAALLERRGEWKRALDFYSRISRLSPVDAQDNSLIAKEARQAAGRVKKIKSYLMAVEERDEKEKRQVPLLR